MIKKRPIKFRKIIRGVLIFQVVCTSLFLFKVIADLGRFSQLYSGAVQCLELDADRKDRGDAGDQGVFQQRDCRFARHE